MTNFHPNKVLLDTHYRSSVKNILLTSLIRTLHSKPAMNSLNHYPQKMFHETTKNEMISTSFHNIVCTYFSRINIVDNSLATKLVSAVRTSQEFWIFACNLKESFNQYNYMSSFVVLWGSRSVFKVNNIFIPTFSHILHLLNNPMKIQNYAYYKNGISDMSNYITLVF